MLVKSRLVITLIVLLITLIAATAKAQASQNAQIILNLLNGQQYFGVPHVYQGDNGTLPIGPTNKWPVYYGPGNASQYWSSISTSINQPVLELVPAQQGVAGAMFWSETYSGGVINITIIGTFSKGTIYPAPSDGFEIYLFLNPTMWGISPQYNYSIPYLSPIESKVILPQSSTPYIVVQWDPLWQTTVTMNGTTGQWNVWIVNNTNGNNPSIGPSPSPNLGSYYAGWEGIGTGAFQPDSGDWIKITVTYDPSTNTLSGVAYDLNGAVYEIGWRPANFTLNLNGYFTPPSSGNYVFGVGASTGSFSYANWALLYVATTQQTTTPPTPSSSLGCSRATVLALRQILGGEYQVGQFIGANSSSFSCLYFGTVNGQLYELSSRLYFIEPPGINSIVLYPPGSSYWNGLNSSLYVLQLMPNVKGWSNDNLVVNSSNVPYSGGNYTVILVGTYTQYSWTNYNYPADGFYVSMFIKPVAALVNETANYTISAFKLVESQTPYLIVGWDPISAVWPVGPGEFKIAIVYPNGTYVTLLDEGGQGHIQGLEPGDLILMKVTYDSYTNAVYAEVVDLNSSSEINIAFPLANYFTPPQPGYYWTSVYSWSGWEAANWGIVYYAVSATTQQTPTPPTPSTTSTVILNLLNGQQYFGVPHVYQGDYNGTPTNEWPVYYGPSNASQYWSSTSINQPVLELTPYLGIPAYVLNKPGTAGGMFWNENYSGGTLTVTLLGTFSNGQPPGQFADGFDIYLFLKPTMWSVSPQYNYSVSYISTSRLQGINVYLGGDEIIPQSSTPCLIVQWDPFLEPVYHVSGQWDDRTPSDFGRFSR